MTRPAPTPAERPAVSAPAPRPGQLVIDVSRLGSRLGLVLGGLGLLLIGFGWNGAASNDLVVEQLPYVLSGGLLGLALVVLGAAYTVVQNAREDSSRVEAQLAELLVALAENGSAAGGPAHTPVDASGLVAAGSASYHEPDCRLVDGREATTYLTPAEAVGRGLKACRVCTPAGASGPQVTLS